MSLRRKPGSKLPARRDPAEQPQVLVERRVGEVGPDRAGVAGRVGDERARHELVRARVGREQRVAAGVVARRRRDRVVLAREVVDGEAGRDGLHVERVGDRSAACGSPVCARDSAPVTCSAPASGSSSPVSLASTNQSASTVRSPSGPRSVTAPIRSPSVCGGDRRVLAQDLDPGRLDERVDHRERHARLAREPAHGRGARVEVGPRAGGGGQRRVRAVVGADRLAQRPVAGGAAELLDPRVLVERHGLARQLPAEPVGRLAEHHARAALRRGHGGRDAAEPAADDEDVRPQIDDPEKKKNQTSNASAAISTVPTSTTSSAEIRCRRRWSLHALAAEAAQPRLLAPRRRAGSPAAGRAAPRARRAA